MPFPYIFTFYSYKGGVGRSMALMNVAYRLAGWGRHVLMVDMDLEAPGLSRTVEFAPCPPKDVIDLLTDAISVLAGRKATKEIASGLPPLATYIRSVIDDNLIPMTPRLGTLGRLDLVGVDVNREHVARVAQLELGEVHRDQLLEVSSLIHYYLKDQRFLHKPFWAERFEQQIQTPYDYVLVDSRTGITEIGGLCVGPLSDRLVVVSGLNNQNVVGTKEVLSEIGIGPEPSGENFSPWDEADVRSKQRGRLGPKPTILVAGPVPQETTLSAGRLHNMRIQLGDEPSPVSYHPLQAMIETVFVREHPRTQLASEYEDLTSKIMFLVADDLNTLAEKARIPVGGRNIDSSLIDSALEANVRLAPFDENLASASLGALTISAASRNTALPQMRQAYALLSQQPGLESYALVHWGIRLVMLGVRLTHLRQGGVTTRGADGEGS